MLKHAKNGKQSAKGDREESQFIESPFLSKEGGISTQEPPPDNPDIRAVQAAANVSPAVVAQRKLQAAADAYVASEDAPYGSYQELPPPPLQLKAGKPWATTQRDSPESTAKPNQTGLPDQLKSGIEGLSGYSLDDVNVHYNSSQPAQLQAQAYAQGTDIHIGPGQERHLPHEAWHVVQQKEGRVQATQQFKQVGINDDAGLEREADVMGARALNWTGSAGTAREAPISGQVAQMARPGAIGHATNSCFAAAIVNTFVSVNSLRNLLLPSATLVGDAPEVAALKQLLLRAVNSVDGQQNVPAAHMQLVMQAFAANGLVANSVDTADVHEVLTRLIDRLAPVAAGGGAPAAPLSAGQVPWGPSVTLQDAAMISITQGAMVALPHVIQVARIPGNTLAAPSVFSLSVPGQSRVYHLRSATQHDQGYKKGHFVSYLNRGDLFADEWWESDDLAPAAVPLAGPQGAPTGDVPGSDDDRMQEEVLATEARGETKSADSADDDGGMVTEPLADGSTPLDEAAAEPKLTQEGMQRQAMMYVYEALDTGLDPALDQATQVGDAAGDGFGEAMRGLQEAYDYQIALRLEENEKGKGWGPAPSGMGKPPASGSSSDPKPDPATLDLTAQVEDAETEQEVYPIVLPPIVLNAENIPEAVRQIDLQMEGLRRMTQRQWLMNVLLNRLKDTDSLMAGMSHTHSGTELSLRIGQVVEGDDALARDMLGEVVSRMRQLLRLVAPSQDGLMTLIQSIMSIALQAIGRPSQVMYYADSQGFLDRMRELSRTGLPGGIGRQHGSGDEESFKSTFSRGKTVIDAHTEEDRLNAVLHNPDQVAGGHLEIFHDATEEDGLQRAQQNFLQMAGALATARKELQAIPTYSYEDPAPSRAKGQGLHAYFDRKPSVETEASKKKRAQAEAAQRERIAILERLLEDARNAFLDLYLQHYGSNSVNSRLGAMWIEDLPEDRSVNRVRIMLESVLYNRELNPGTWEDERMAVHVPVQEGEVPPLHERGRTEATNTKLKKEAKSLESGHGGSRKRKPSKTAREDKAENRLGNIKFHRKERGGNQARIDTTFKSMGNRPPGHQKLTEQAGGLREVLANYDRGHDNLTAEIEFLNVQLGTRFNERHFNYAQRVGNSVTEQLNSYLRAPQEGGSPPKATLTNPRAVEYLEFRRAAEERFHTIQPEILHRLFLAQANAKARMEAMAQEIELPKFRTYIEGEYGYVNEEILAQAFARDTASFYREEAYAELIGQLWEQEQDERDAEWMASGGDLPANARNADDTEDEFDAGWDEEDLIGNETEEEERVEEA